MAPLFGSPARYSRQPTTDHEPDFSAFAFGDDEEEEHRALAVGQTSSTPSSSTSSLNPPHRARGAIALTEDLHHPLDTVDAASHHLRGTASIPGAYNFEPEGGTPTHSRSQSRPTLPRLSQASPARSYHRPMTLSERLLPAALYARLSTARGDHQQNESDSVEDHGLLFSHDGQDEDDPDPDPHSATTYPPRGTPSHVPLPSRPPSFAPPV
ncbi:hypothetical protein P7C70_g4880, partial [Phenoliferia sp. Uapishka_3]